MIRAQIQITSAAAAIEFRSEHLVIAHVSCRDGGLLYIKLLHRLTCTSLAFTSSQISFITHGVNLLKTDGKQSVPHTHTHR